MPPNDLERELLALAAEERQRRETARAEDEVSPRLDRIFTYWQARDAAEAAPPSAGDLRVQARTPVGEVTVDLPRNSRVARAIEQGGDISMSVAQPVPNANGDVFPDISVEDLSVMFMTNEARAQREITGVRHEDIPVDDPFQVEFSGEFQEGATQPNEAARFQIGREAPPPVTMMSRRMVPTDGRVVSTRGEDGRFHATRPTGVAEATADAHEVMADQRRFQSAPLSPRPVGPRPQAPEGASGLPRASRDCYRPSALERIAGDDMFGDDD